jgi:hypothetical protein
MKLRCMWANKMANAVVVSIVFGIALVCAAPAGRSAQLHQPPQPDDAPGGVLKSDNSNNSEDAAVPWPLRALPVTRGVADKPTVQLTDFGGMANSGRDNSGAFKAAFAKLKRTHGGTLIVPGLATPGESVSGLLIQASPPPFHGPLGLAIPIHIPLHLHARSHESTYSWPPSLTGSYHPGPCT